MKITPVFVSLLAASALAFVACETVPQTGRSSLQLVPEAQLASAAQAQFGQLKQETPISDDPRYNAMVQRVGERIAYVAAEDMPDADWEFVVFDDDSQVNAFAMPGGKVAVYTGIFKVAETDEELAVVMGHEIAHVAARHGGERVSQNLLAAGGAAALQLGTSDMDSGDRQLLMAAYGAGATLGVLMPYSRHHEKEADEIGLIYSAKAGYDPRAAIGFWQKMEAEKNGSPPEFLSTHPSGATRIARLKEIMPKALLAYERSKQ
ncbi:MAG: M48 family metallopeptidase [Verrucomicrobiota bacterium]